MVHALEEIRRVLLPGGILIDLRPLADRWRVEVVSGAGIQEMVWPISFSMAATFFWSEGVTMVMAVPLRPARPVRPIRCT